ncbi:DUF485 domain-containing protein [Brevibacterium sp. 50QC2O2]|jgi:uncharacterized membrane protein (DUF485 family)|uniref:DUF485 domain-containing protein n=1 Tax=Brevibacterium TaxID=1696 RepID=UPI00211C30F2|nr:MULTISPECIES: DUF485 domain-containing protein [unclassified Brevibacterium]MCQ9367564.1 DUF485 domain-containing protein [Brevibacterium sp. 91QC2O2]MCQ9386300.1 DUF485 domain-containing protein [Brevibacterium sp. 68QC2CO]MCQ9389434.1 DUF485 domain-containing protein [Brevibacterium sp. 50QC2O2]
MTDETSQASPAPQTGPGSGQIDFIAVDRSPEFGRLRRTYRSIAFPLTALFMVWYLVYVLLGAYAHDFMAKPVFGLTNMGIVLGLGQFVTTFVITIVYVQLSKRRIEPQAHALRNELEARVPTEGN